MYPPVLDEGLREELAPYAEPKGSLQFPLDKPLPCELIGLIVKARLRSNQARAQLKARGKTSRPDLPKRQPEP